MHCNWPFLCLLDSLAACRKWQYPGISFTKSCCSPTWLKFSLKDSLYGILIKTWQILLPFDFIQAILVLFQKRWHLKSPVWHSLFSWVLFFISSLEYRSFAPIPMVLLNLLWQWSLTTALLLTNAVSHPTRETAGSKKTDDLCHLVLLLVFLGRSEMCSFLTVDWIQTVVSLTEQILIIKNTENSNFFLCRWRSAFPLGLYLFPLSDNFGTVTHTLT